MKKMETGGNRIAATIPSWAALPRLLGSSDCVDFVEDCEGEAGRLNRGLVGRLLSLGCLVESPVRLFESSPSANVREVVMVWNSAGCLEKDDREADL